MFFSPFSIAITSLWEERANLSAFRTFVRFVLVWFRRVPLPIGVWKGLRFVIVALPGLNLPFFFTPNPWIRYLTCLFVCVEVLRPSQPNGVMSSAVSLPNHKFTGQASSFKRLTSIVHILSPETDNCPSWISRRERMTVENISWSISLKEYCRPRRGLNPRPPGIQSDGASNWATEAGWPVRGYSQPAYIVWYWIENY